MNNKAYNSEYIKAIKYSHNESEQFLKAKLENVHDDLPHLVHADWLEEHDMPTTAHVIRRVLEDRPNTRIYQAISKFNVPKHKTKNGFVKDVVRHSHDDPDTHTLYLTHYYSGKDQIEDKGTSYINYILKGHKDHIKSIKDSLEEEGVPDEVDM